MKARIVGRYLFWIGIVTWAGSYVAGKQTLIEQVSAAGLVMLGLGLAIANIED